MTLTLFIMNIGVGRMWIGATIGRDKKNLALLRYIYLRLTIPKKKRVISKCSLANVDGIRCLGLDHNVLNIVWIWTCDPSTAEKVQNKEFPYFTVPYKTTEYSTYSTLRDVKTEMNYHIITKVDNKFTFIKTGLCYINNLS